MAYRKSSTVGKYVVVNHSIAQSKTLTMEARGLIAFMLSLPSDWNYTNKWLQDNCPGWGREKLRGVIKELTSLGLLIRTPRRSEDGRRLAGWDWEVFDIPRDTPELPETRNTESEGRQNSTTSERRVSSQSDNQSDGPSTTTKERVKQNKRVSKLTTRPIDNFVDQIMTELLTDGLPKKYHRYASLKAKEFETRWPDSGSVADGWSYVAKAIEHKINLTGH